MGMYQSTYHAFGVHVPRYLYEPGGPWTETERLDELIAELGLGDTGLGHLTAGNYDRDELFLVVVRDGEDCEVKLGSFAIRRPKPFTHNQDPRPGLIARLAEAAGYGDLGEPGWLVIPDVS